MAKSNFFGPLSGDVTQAINPWSWWTNSMSQMGFININRMESADPEVERQILEQVAGYGKQLGRIVEALSVLLAHGERVELNPEERQAIDTFQKMAAKISAIKLNRIALAEEDADAFIQGLRRLKEHDPEAFDRIRSKLSKELHILGRLTA
jgi:hypothetical protein